VFQIENNQYRGWGFIKVFFYLKIKFHLKNKKLIN